MSKTTMNKWKDIKTWNTSPAEYVAAGTRYTSAGDEWVEVGNRASIGNFTTIGNRASIGNDARIGDSATIGNDATIGDFTTIGNFTTIGDGCHLDKTPLYIWPEGGKWPVCVCDPEKRLVSIGCEVHTIEEWLGGKADAVRKKYGWQETAVIYDPVLRSIPAIMGWEDS